MCKRLVGRRYTAPLPRRKTVKAYVVLKDGAKASEEDLILWCRGRLAKFKVPTEIEFRQDLPKTMVGKVLRRALREEELAKRSAGTEG